MINFRSNRDAYGRYTRSTLKSIIRLVVWAGIQITKVRGIKSVFGVLAIGVALFISAFFFPAPIHYEVEAKEEPVVEVEEVVYPEMLVYINWTKERINQEIDTQAAKYKTDAAYLKKIVACESGYDTDIQSRHVLSYGRERSFGLVQIHLPSHPHITYEQAIDPLFAIEYLAKHVASGTDYWSCEKMI